MYTKENNIQSQEALHRRIVELERFKDEEVKPFIQQTGENLKKVNTEIVEISEEISKVRDEHEKNVQLFKDKVKQLEVVLYSRGFKEYLMIGLIVFLLMYIIIKVII